MNRLKALAGAAALAVMSAAIPAQAVNFVLTPSGTGTLPGTQARQGFDIAAAYWSSVFTDNVTVRLNIGFSTLGTGILGSTGSTRVQVYASQVYAAMAADSKTAIDVLAQAGLPTLTTGNFNAQGAVTAVTNGFANGTTAANGYTTATSRIDNDGTANNTVLSITQASAKALGITTNYQGAAISQTSSDGSITFSNAFAFDFNPTDGIDAQSFDFISVAIHEIGHALGFVSGVDTYDARTTPGSTTLSSLENSAFMSQGDLFRYSADSNGTLDWRTGGTPYFSLDKGATQLFGDSRFSTGVANGDGRQASHWKDSPAGAPQLGILDPTAARGQMGEITALDLAYFDVIGWDVNFNVLQNQGYRFTTAQAYRAFATAVPEPATWGMMILGFGVIGGAMRRRGAAGVRFA